MTQTWEEAARAVNAMMADAERCFRLALSLKEVDDVTDNLERANERLRTMEKRKLEYEGRVRRRVKEDKRKEFNFMMYMVAANDLINFLKSKIPRAAASKEKVAATAVRTTCVDMAAKCRGCWKA